MIIPEAGQQRLKALHLAYVLSKRDLAYFSEGLLLGMGLSPDDWEVNTHTMALTPQSEAKVQSNGVENKR